MQAKLILIATAATILISAVVISFGVIFGSSASGNFKITARQYIDLKEDGTEDVNGASETISASHLDGSVKFSYVRSSRDPNVKLLLQVVGNMAYEYSYKPADTTTPAEWVLASCQVIEGKLQGVGEVTINEIALTKLDEKTFGVGTEKEEIFTIHMVDGKPSELTRGKVIKYTVTDWAQDSGEISFEAPIPTSNAICDGSSLLPPTPSDVTPPSRRLDATGYSPNQDHWWVSVVGFAKWGNNIGYGNVIVNENYLKMMGFTFVERVVRNNAHGVFFKYSNGGGCGVAIAGTDDGTDAMQDLNAWPVSCYGGGTCHQGFMSHYNLLKGDFERLFNANGCAGKKFIFAGHSLGGATAMVMAHDYIYGKKWVSVQNSIVRTAGNPRPFAYNYAPDLGRTTRQINDQDPIPLLPPRLCLWGWGLCYTHPKAEVHACTRYSAWKWGGCGWFCPGYWYTVRECSVRSNDWNYSLSLTGFTHLLKTYFEYTSWSSIGNAGP